MKPLLAALVLALVAVAPARAATLAVRVLDSGGKPVRDAVVVAQLPGAHPMPVDRGPVGRGYAILQKDIMFHPFVLVVPAGATVSFPNDDNTRHQVYSFSAPKRFELKLFARDQSRSVTFDKPGVVALGCNIHDRMSAFIFVADNAWTARTDDNGVAVLPGLPNAGGHLLVWHPFLRAPSNAMAVPLEAGQRSVTVPVRLRPPPLHAAGSY